MNQLFKEKLPSTRLFNEENSKDKKSLLDFYKKIINESNRVLIKKGLLIFKCQDMTHTYFWVARKK